MVNISETTKNLISWIREWFDANGKDCNAIIGMSGGKDSTVVAKLCVEALGKDRVIGVAMPDEGQGINDADKICEWLGIRYMCMPISGITASFPKYDWSVQSEQNIPPRIRMTMLYAISQSNNGRVIGTCNASENFIGYFTRYGDGASDVEPIGNLTVREVKAIGYELGIPREWVDKIPDDGLPHSCPDDEKFKEQGFSYELIDNLLENGTSGVKAVDGILNNIHEKTLFKMGLGTMFPIER